MTNLPTRVLISVVAVFAVAGVSACDPNPPAKPTETVTATEVPVQTGSTQVELVPNTPKVTTTTPRVNTPATTPTDAVAPAQDTTKCRPAPKDGRTPPPPPPGAPVLPDCPAR